MKLAILSFYSGVSDRGAETFVQELARRLAKNHQVTVFQTGSKSAIEDYEIVRISVKPIPENQATTNFWRRLFLTPRQISEFRFYLAALSKIVSGNYDVVIPVNSGWQIPLYKLASLFVGFKLVISGQSGPGWDDRWNLFWRPDLFIALTKTQAKWARKISPRQKLAVIPNGVDLDKFTPQGKKLKLDLPRPIVLAVAASIPSKRLAATIEAVALTNASLLIVGSGYLDQEIDRHGRVRLGRRYLRLKLPHQQMSQVYRAVDAFTLCSDSSEAFGIVYLEALACGLPVVATDDDSRREILGKAGIFVKNPTDSQEYAKALNRALKQKHLKQSQDQAKKYSWDEIAGKYETVLDFG